MQTSFEAVHAGKITGALTTVDRLIVHGHLRQFWFNRGFLQFLLRQGVRVPGGFGSYVRAASDRLKAHGEGIARKAGRPLIYQERTVRGKDDLARQIATRDGVTEGLICVFSTLELANCFALVGGNVVPRLRKCLHLYFYFIDRDLGFMHVRLQTWFPFQVQIYVNGREWLARQLDKCRVGYARYQNTFLEIEDLSAAEKLCQSFPRRRWWRVFDALARRVNPLLPLIRQSGFGSYYWAINDCEVATDLMWKSRRSLTAVMEDLVDHALRAFSAKDVVRFLGWKALPSRAELDSVCKPLHAAGEVTLARARRPEGRRIKHRIRRNWIKMYDKWSVLRIETVINNPTDFRVLRFETDRKGRRRGRWMRMGKGLHNLERYLQVGEGANRRYLEALAEVRPTRHTIGQLDQLCRARRHLGRHYARFNPVTAADCTLFRAVLAGEHLIAGFKNRDLQRLLYGAPATDVAETKRRCARVSRLIAKLRGHGLVAKVKDSRLYRVTPRGHRVMAAALRFRMADFPNAMAA